MFRRHTYWILCLAVLLLAGFSVAEPPKNAAAQQPQLSNADCLACHSDASLTKEVNGKQVSLHVREDVFTNSVHGQMFKCTDCHKDITSVPHESNLAKPTCTDCHSDAQAKYDGSLHAKAIAGGNAQAARCADCHGNIHEVVPASDAKSPVFHANIPKTCASCHSQKFVMQGAGVSTAPVLAYQESVHGKLVAGGDAKAAVCSDCHSSHDIRKASDSQSSISKQAVANVCAKCHDAETKVFQASIHGQRLAKGDLHSASCTDCHGIHAIKSHTDPKSPVFAKNVATEACAQCHGSSKMNREFGIDGDRVSSYLANYHGMAKQVGSGSSATCSSCHGVHNILPAGDPKSTINSANLVQTCAQCHSGANESFVSARIHEQPLAADIGSKIVGYVKAFYILTIFGTIGFMLLHNLIILRKKLADRRTGHVHHGSGPRVVVRMTKKQRIQHAMLFVTFFLLVFTGFALKYPQSWLATMFINEFIRSWVHRIAGALMIVASLYHVYYLAFEKEGRQMFWDMLPELKDATDIVQVFKYYLGFSTVKPQFKRFNYAEKMEYWALVWGTIVMAVTGVMIWAKVVVGSTLPGWTIDVAIAVHFYEAILATLAIIVWHFYMVIFDPDTYPVNWAWLDGKMSVEHYREEHGLDSETLSKFANSEEHEHAGKH